MMPTLCVGGILADVMGLGKTLSVLTLIASTMRSANDYQSLHQPSGMRTRATLVVVTSAR